MNKEHFIKKLNGSLKRLPVDERQDILQDFEEHFFIGTQEGKTEEEVSLSLGSPVQIGKEMLAEYHLEKVDMKASTGNIFRALWAVAGLSFFNLVIVLGPLLGLMAILFAGWVIGISFIASPLLVLVDSVFQSASFDVLNLFISIALAGFGLLILTGMFKTTQWLTTMFIRYLHYNVQFVKGGMKHEQN